MAEQRDVDERDGDVVSTARLRRLWTRLVTTQSG
jgi:hypothetical protein